MNHKPKFKTREHKAFKSKTDQQPKHNYSRVAKKAGTLEGKVTIRVKGSEKQTGALSPRAPEKIRKNRNEEMKVYGENSCNAVFNQRPDSIVRLWATIEMAKKQGDLLSYLAENKKAYHIVDNEELMKVTGTEHHGGICLLVKKAKTFSLEGYLSVLKQQDCLILLDDVNNAQNIGGIIRTCAFYGVKGIITENSNIINSSNSARVAEGGLEFVRVLETKHKQIALTQLRKAGYQIIHLTHNKKTPFFFKTKIANKVVFVLSEIISNEIDYPEDTTVQLSVVNPLQSGLNVAVNSGVLLAHWYHLNRI
ncbi:TrmH family RNA methyltransferase [Pasteurella skyensis]|uniref:TrmH family RNA methyltransferase n=1 Tax=Phocoenobacter skyensis TaxID=97481 RepID=A0AAJ6NDK3_9PAST|nr:TrmH family RNA methyltransferase [Pasteurella skyensis]MDP8170704.1 TrmH family RNA methyltransferase [Pasteurella skyensis]MDP8174815.1 TrmH family RNA methyltransferase [Pasteurella skyensis]